MAIIIPTLFILVTIMKRMIVTIFVIPLMINKKSSYIGFRVSRLNRCPSYSSGFLLVIKVTHIPQSRILTIKAPTLATSFCFYGDSLRALGYRLEGLEVQLMGV